MNFSLLFGLVIGIFCIAVSAFSEMRNSHILLSAHAAYIVLGGTLAATLICFPLKTCIDLIKIFFRTVTGAQKAKMRQAMDEIVLAGTKIHAGESIGDVTERL
ncbi:hypothetical protein K2X33_04570, partial [bacterium]|nr:hypothetical protein [bacterium]